MKRKLMLISPMLHQGGFERICVLTARLLKDSFDVVIVVFSMEDIAFDISGLSVINLNLKAKAGKIGKMLNVVRRSLKLSFLQKKLGTEISYSFGMTANIANALSFGAKRKICACHSFGEIHNASYMKLVSGHSDKVLCCAKKMADLVQERYGFANIVPLWNPCDGEAVLKQSSAGGQEDISFFREGDRILVSMGREDDVKGFWHLLKIFRRVNEEAPDTRLAIIGEGAFTEYKSLAEALGIGEGVLFAGLKKNPFPYLKESDIYVLTSLSEGLPNALVEALALSLPVVSANCLSGPAEILHEDFKTAEKEKDVFFADYGVLTPPLSWEKDFSVKWKEEKGTKKIRLDQAQEKFAGAILTLLQNKEIYEKYRKNAVLRAQDFSTARYVEELCGCMERI